MCNILFMLHIIFERSYLLKNLTISELLYRTTCEMLKEYSELRFFSSYDKIDKRVNTSEVIYIFDEILENIKNSHPKGKKYYAVLYNQYFRCGFYRKHKLCEIVGLEVSNRPITESTLYRWQVEAVCVFGGALWKHHQFSDFSLEVFKSEYVKQHINEIKLEHLRMING